MEKLLKVGQIVNTQGIRGEVRVYPLTDYKERFEELEWVYMDANTKEKFFIERVRYKNNLVILKLKGIDDINVAEKYKNKYITISRENARKLPEDTYFITDLVGLKVYSEENELIGIMKNVIQSAGNDIYEVVSDKDPKKTILIPAVGEFIKEVNLDKGMIIVKIIEGLIE
ncbi:ribosome maturation factor RimM [Thermotalea metallivorans]|uniref:Ribosome maturation factor RimM n=1 Tax=Thermotalea metallivorans TaxID=520762 RepID=A0A140LEN7_9FIRM|nr:ribosome maturation factor RimM [Thermotalea metallivorans]KXG79012.1 Ribosome maturation factor RimM [Thermotalea metallivorans]